MCRAIQGAVSNSRIAATPRSALPGTSPGAPALAASSSAAWARTSSTSPSSGAARPAGPCPGARRRHRPSAFPMRRRSATTISATACGAVKGFSRSALGWGATSRGTSVANRRASLVVGGSAPVPRCPRALARDARSPRRRSGRRGALRRAWPSAEPGSSPLDRCPRRPPRSREPSKPSRQRRRRARAGAEHGAPSSSRSGSCRFRRTTIPRDGPCRPADVRPLNRAAGLTPSPHRPPARCASSAGA